MRYILSLCVLAGLAVVHAAAGPIGYVVNFSGQFGTMDLFNLKRAVALTP